MTRQQKVDLAANFLMGAAVGIIVAALGAPGWAIFGFGYTAFLLARLLQ